MMSGNSFIRLFAAAVIILKVITFSAAQSAGRPARNSFENIAADPHTGPVTCLVHDASGNIFSAGEDGFVNLWNVQRNAALRRFQLSPYPIIAMAQRPGHPHITIIESDGMGFYRISAWDYLHNKKLFTLRFRDPVSYITYSKNGSFLIAARTGRTGIVFINPENGGLLQAPQDLTNTVTFAATGRSERTMIAYSPSGTLSYWNLETGEFIQQVTVPQNMRSTVLLNNNLFFAGIDRSGLVIIDALSGNEISRNNLIQDGELFAVSEASRELICIQKLDERNNRYMLLRIDNNGYLRMINQKTIPAHNVPITSSMYLNGQIVFGREDGKINLYQQQYNSMREMQTGHQLVINEIAVSGNSLAILNNERLQNPNTRNTHSQYENGIAFLPADFNAISSDMIIRFEQTDDCDRIHGADIATDNEYFVLWKSRDVNYSPVIRNNANTIISIEGLSQRYALRSSSLLNNLILFLDITGNITIYNIDTKKIEYRYNAAGTLHASFIDERNIILARSANTGNTPFLMLNTSTGETVPISYPAGIGMTTYLGKNGTIYAAVINQNDGESVTTIINIDTSRPSDSRSLVEYQGEDTSFSIAECEGNLATSLGGDGVTLFTRNNFNLFERSSGLPVKLVNTEKYFIVLDNSGSILWHNAFTGEIEAELCMYDGKWYLQKKNGDVLEGEIQSTTHEQAAGD